MDVAVEISLELLAVIRNLVQRLTFSTPLSVLGESQFDASTKKLHFGSHLCKVCALTDYQKHFSEECRLFLLEMAVLFTL